MSTNVQKMSLFVWSPQKLAAAEGIARDENRDSLAARIGVNKKTVKRWEQHPDFQLKVASIIMEIDITQKSERMKIIKQVIQKKLELAIAEGGDLSKKDLLDWLKFAGEEVGDYTPIQKIETKMGVQIYIPHNGREDDMQTIEEA